MSVVGDAHEEHFVGLDRRAETRLPERWVAAIERARDVAILVVIAAVQVAWLAAFGYAAYLFLL